MAREKSGFEKLEVYRLSEKLADTIYACVLRWDSLDRDTVGKQMIRSADSIGANLAEGYGRGTVPDRIRFARIAIGSLYETKHWLRRAHQRRLLDKQQIADLRPLLQNLLPMLNGYKRSIARGRAVLPTPDLQPPTP